MLSLTHYVDDSLLLVTDADGSGDLSSGDTVTYAPGADWEQTGLVYGTDAFSTIQDAINNAGDGDTILVDSGTYNEALTIAGKSLDLVGDPGDALEGAGSAAPVLTGAGLFGTGVTISGAAAVVGIEGFQLSSWFGGGISVVDAHLDLAHSTLSTVPPAPFDVSQFGVDLDGATADIEQSVITAAGGSLVTGLAVREGGSATVFQSEISNATQGVVVGSNTARGSAVIEESLITGNATGVFVYSAGNAMLHGNSLASNSSVAVTTNTAAAIDAAVNWWGTTDDSDIAANRIGGQVDFTPYLEYGTDTAAGTAGFQGDVSALHVTALGRQIAGGRVQEGINAVPSGGTVRVDAGT